MTTPSAKPVKQPTQEQIDALKDEHGEVFLTDVVEVEDGIVFAFKVPTREQHRRFLSVSSDTERRPVAIERYVIEAVLFPPKEEFAALLNRYPGLPLTLVDPISKSIGMIQGIGAKKA